MNKRMKEILEWASKLTAESYGDEIRRFFWTEEAKLALFKLKTYKNHLLGLVGLQGVGKSSTIRALKNALIHYLRFEKKDYSHVVLLKWRTYGDPWDQLFDCYSARGKYCDEVYDALMETPKIKNLLMRWRYEDKPWLDQLNFIKDQYDVEQAEKCLGTKICSRIKRGIVHEFLTDTHTIFLDSPDCSKRDSRLIVRDLDGMQKFWQYMHDNIIEVNIVICMQKELFRGDHFFYGKWDVVTLNPLKPEQLVQAYKQINPFVEIDEKWQGIPHPERDHEPLTEDALLLLAQLARGVFRRFQRYVQACIERQIISGRESELINEKDVNAAITEDMLVKDMELELCEIFQQAHQRAQAVKTLNFLRVTGEANQKEIAEQLDISEAVAGKLVSKLASYGYVNRRRGEKGAWLVSLRI